MVSKPFCRFQFFLSFFFLYFGLISFVIAGAFFIVVCLFRLIFWWRRGSRKEVPCFYCHSLDLVWTEGWSLFFTWQRADIVAVLMDSRPQFVFTWLALSKLGAISALLNSNQRGLLMALHIFVLSLSGRHGCLFPTCCLMYAGAALWRSVQASSATAIVFGAETREGIDGIIEEVRKSSVALYCEGGSSLHAQNITDELLKYPITAPDRSVRSGLTPDDIWGFIFTRYCFFLPDSMLQPILWSHSSLSKNFNFFKIPVERQDTQRLAAF